MAHGFLHRKFAFAVKSIKVSKGAKIRNRYNQAPHLTQDTNGKVTNSKLDTTKESQEVSLFRAGDHKAHINRRAQRHSITLVLQSELPRQIPWNAVESDLGCTLRIFFDNVTLTLLIKTRNHANTITSVIAAKQTVINEVRVCSIKYRYSLLNGT